LAASSSDRLWRVTRSMMTCFRMGIGRGLGFDDFDWVLCVCTSSKLAAEVMAA
jgi:hypothetical protein